MRFAAVLYLVGGIGAFVLPDAQTFEQLAIHNQDGKEAPSRGSIISALHGAFDDAFHDFLELDESLENAALELPDAPDQLFDNIDEDEDSSAGDHTENRTIYQLISTNRHTTKFAELLSEYEDLIDLLNSTKANHTLFVPVNEAFSHIPDHKKPSKKFIEDVLRYHITHGLYPAAKILATHTLPTALEEKLLGGRAQRLRVRVGITGLRVNFYSKVIFANARAKNGVIHAVDKILVPPPMVGREISLFPQRFSSLLYAYDKTDFVSFIHKVRMNGSTVFAPTNAAFARLGPRANAFLFNTPTGLKYLKALLKYHIVANSTLYSDAFYRPASDNGGVDANRHYHVDLPSLLGDKSIAVDIGRLGGLIHMRVNGHVPVAVQDGIAKNGVIHVVNRLLIPPHKPHDSTSCDGEMDVECLKQILGEYIQDDRSSWVSDL